MLLLSWPFRYSGLQIFSLVSHWLDCSSIKVFSKSRIWTINSCNHHLTFTFCHRGSRAVTETLMTQNSWKQMTLQQPKMYTQKKQVWKGSHRNPQHLGQNDHLPKLSRDVLMGLSFLESTGSVFLTNFSMVQSSIVTAVRKSRLYLQ